MDGEVNWGDETTDPVSVKTDTIELTHTYPSTGSYTIIINVTDSVGNHASDKVIFEVGESNNERLWLIVGLTVTSFIVVLGLIAYTIKRSHIF